MQLLDKASYYKVEDPLKEVIFNNLFARSVVEKKVEGLIFVDNVDTPETFYVVHPYGMSLLFGRSNNPVFNAQFKDYALSITNKWNKNEWMQAFPNSWDCVLKKLFEGYIISSAENTTCRAAEIIELNTRINFAFNSEKYAAFKKQFNSSDYTIVRTDKLIFQEMKGSVVPSAFWNNADDFVNYGVGFSHCIENKVVATAFSAFIHDQKLEIGIETIEKYRGKGLAQAVCSAIIDYCIINNYEPIWSCRLENTGSCKLARSLGFEPVLEIPFYCLSN